MGFANTPSYVYIFIFNNRYTTFFFIMRSASRVFGIFVGPIFRKSLVFFCKKR